MKQFCQKFVVLKKRRSNDILLSCGSQIKYYRKLKGFTQEQVSAQLDMDFSQYGKIERGLTNITLSTLSDIAVAAMLSQRICSKKSQIKLRQQSSKSQIARQAYLYYFCAVYDARRHTQIVFANPAFGFELLQRFH